MDIEDAVKRYRAKTHTIHDLAIAENVSYKTMRLRLKAAGAIEDPDERTPTGMTNAQLAELYNDKHMTIRALQQVAGLSYGGVRGRLVREGVQFRRSGGPYPRRDV